MFAAFHIISGVVAYRLRRLEMANLAGTTSIALALHLPLPDVFLRTLFAFGLNVLVYLNNDYVDVALDLHAREKDAAKTRFLAEHLRAALFVQLGLSAILVGFAAAYDLGLLLPLLAGGGICVWYSVQLKRYPFVDIPAMMAWGALMPLCGSPLDVPLGVCLALQLGLFSGVFETIQVMRDAPEDAAQSVRTTGVVLGSARSLWLTRALMLFSSVYALAFAAPLCAAVTAAAPLLPFRHGREVRYWTQVKLVYGIAWLVLLGLVFARGHSAGLFAFVDAHGWHRRG